MALLAQQLSERSVVATGVASRLAILAIATAKATHAPNLTYLSCVGSLTTLHRSSEALASLDGRRAEVSIADLFDHARRQRVDTVFFGAAEVDVQGRTNMSGAGSLKTPKGTRSLVNAVQVVSTQDHSRRTTLITDLAIFEVGPTGATLLARHPWASEALISQKTGFAYATAEQLQVQVQVQVRVRVRVRVRAI